MSQFDLVSEFAPRGAQPKAIQQLTNGLRKGEHFQTLRGLTGSGKTYVAANVIAQWQRPTLVIAHNKTLAAQLCAELREFFPNNAVEYFVSYYDYYQPEAYVPSSDTFIEKDASINDEIDRLRHSTTQSISERPDVIVVASVSCIFGIGSPDMYQGMTIKLERGETKKRETIIRELVNQQFTRNDLNLSRGTFRARGDVIEIHPADEESVIRIDLFGDEIEDITTLDPLTGEVLHKEKSVVIYPASHYVATQDALEGALVTIRQELDGRLNFFRSMGRILESQRLEQRVRFDMEMLRETGYCTGIENYSRHFDGRKPGEPPFTLMDYFPKDYLLIIDEYHQTIPQLHAMYAGDKSRKDNLVNFGWRLPSAYDNRPLTFDECESRVNQGIFMSATPGPYEIRNSNRPIDLLIRPTGLLDPAVTIRPTLNQVDDLMKEITIRVEKNQRILVTTLTKRMAEDLASYLLDLGTKVQYLHSEVHTLDRSTILRDLRLGEFDVLVGINLLREGLDLPEVSLVVILDADKEGFLRSETSLLQTMGRAARHVEGTVIMYADKITDSMSKVIAETKQRRQIQMKYNSVHDITPQTIRKPVIEYIKVPVSSKSRESEELEKLPVKHSLEQIPVLINQLTLNMKEAAKSLDFEEAAKLRDKISKLRKELIVS